MITRRPACNKKVKKSLVGRMSILPNVVGAYELGDVAKALIIL